MRSLPFGISATAPHVSHTALIDELVTRMSIARPKTTLRRPRVYNEDSPAMRPSRQHQQWNQRYAAPNDPLASLMLPGSNAAGNAPPSLPHTLLPPAPSLGVVPPFGHLPANFPLPSNDPSEEWAQFYPNNTSNPASAPPASFHHIDRRLQQHHRDPNYRAQQHPSMYHSFHQTPGNSFHPGTTYAAQSHRRPNGGTVDNRGTSPRSAPQSSSNPRNYTLRQIAPLRDALDTFDDKSLIISKLAMFLTGSRTALPVNQRRKAILDFAGHPPSYRLPVDILCSLNKADLDNLAWALAVSRAGRKLELAQRIAEALKAPLRWRTPTARRYSGAQVNRRSSRYNSTETPTASNAGIYAQQSQQSSAALANNFRGPPSAMTGNVSRSSMPNLTSRNSFDPYACRLQPALGPRGATGNGSLPPVRNRKDVPALLRGETFMFPETPFNLPLKPPLGDKGFELFTTARLNSGQNDPTITFETPSSSDLGDIEGKGDVQIHLRCLRMEVNKPVRKWKQSWPFPVSSRVNGTSVNLNQAQRYTNGKLAGTDKATNITPYVHNKTKGAENTVVLRRQSSSAASAQGTFVVFAQQVLVRNTATMEAIVKEHSEEFWAKRRQERIANGMDPSTSDFELARLGVVESLTSSDDVAMESMKVSLRCPLSLLHITTPVKGKECAHVQCFDLQSFLQYARRSTKFQCPVCDKPNAHPTTLIICPYLQHALSKFKGCDDVEVSSDGTMAAIESRPQGVASDTDDDDDDKGLVKDKGTPNRANGSGPARNKPTPVVVNLCSDSEDEAETPAAPAENSDDANGQNGTNAPNWENENNDEWNGNTDPQGDDASQEVTFETTFRADEQFLPWGDYSEHDSSAENTVAGSTPRELTPASTPANGTGHYGHLDNIFPSANNSNSQSWSGEVIQIDSD